MEQLTQQQHVFKYFLHFVGKGLYSMEDFVIESEKLGVNRCFPSFILKRMKWGERILLAQYKPEKRDEETAKVLEQSKAVVFGYFVISGLNFECQNKQEFIEKLTEQLKVVSTGEGSGTIKRRCGSYTIGAVYYVTDELKDIIVKAQKTAEELEIKIKIFAGGSFHQFTTKEISPVKFTRTGFFVEIDKEIESEEIKDKKVGFIGNYKQRKYFLKAEKEVGGKC